MQSVQQSCLMMNYLSFKAIILVINVIMVYYTPVCGCSDLFRHHKYWRMQSIVWLLHAPSIASSIALQHTSLAGLNHVAEALATAEKQTHALNSQFLPLPEFTRWVHTWVHTPQVITTCANV